MNKLRCDMECCLVGRPEIDCLGRPEIDVTISPSRKIMYAKIPKSGSSTIQTLFEWYVPDYYHLHGIHPDDALLHFPDYKTLVVCRNPFSRIISGWLFLKHDKLFNSYSATRNLDRQAIDFPEFVHRALQGDLRNHHWDRAVQFVPSRIDFLLRLEDLSDELDKLYSIIGIDGHPELPHERKAVEEASMREVFDENLTSIVQEFYREDFLRFGYSEDLVK